MLDVKDARITFLSFPEGGGGGGWITSCACRPQKNTCTLPVYLNTAATVVIKEQMSATIEMMETTIPVTFRVVLRKCNSSEN